MLCEFPLPAAMAAVSAALHLGISVFQVLLIAGKPWGEYAWGGQNKGVLPARYRVGSAISIVLLLFFSATNLAVGGFLPLPHSGIPLLPLQWVVASYATLGTFVNAASRSRPERLLWTPVAALLAALNIAILWKMYSP